jgi:SAM-dependent methyltransferase
MSSIDWDKHWETNEEPEGARDFAEKMADRLREFMRGKGIGSVADYGCGPATTLFRLADHFTDIDFYGYDIATSIIQKNTEKARGLGLMNLSFVQDSLPNPRKTKTLDLVTCFATLHYVEEIERAIKRLFERVNPGGYLIFNYPNTYTRKTYQEDIQPDDEYMKRRFALLLAGRNLISQRRIREILGARPKKFYSSIKSNIYVLVRKF